MRKLTFLLLLAAGSSLANPGDDLDALRLADTAPTKVEAASEFHWFAEGALGQGFARQAGSAVSHQRLSFDFQLDKTLAPGWRLVLADRLDLNRQDANLQNQPAVRHDVNTLKEAYISWQVQLDQIVDLGRVNVQNGVATGYNPSDFFRSGAVRSLVSVDPASLKKNRLGSVMLRGQHLWNGGSVTALVSPELERQASAASYSPDFGASNHQTRWLFAASQRISEEITPQWLIFGQQHAAPQLGFNLTSLLSDATVAYVEWSGGRSRSLLSQATNDGDDTRFRNRVASGLTYTSANKLSLTLEYEYNGSGADATSWNALRQGSPVVYARYRALQQNVQELATRQEIFVYLSWQDALLNHLDLSAMRKHNLADRSRLTWLEARYHMDKVDLALQWQNNSGDASSVYGAAVQKRAWQALLRYYF